MIATNFSNVRNNFKEVCDRVVHDSDIAIITRKNDENVVLMSQAQYDNLMENLHIRESKVNYEWLKESIRQAEDGGKYGTGKYQRTVSSERSVYREKDHGGRLGAQHP